MKINTNQVGNYTPVPSKNINNFKGTDTLQQKNADKYQLENITKEEKEFFVNKYPENKEEILNYHFYQRSGKLSGVSVGSIFDKRG